MSKNKPTRFGSQRGIAVDSTLILSADSFLSKTRNGHFDPDARKDFCQLFNLFASNRPLYLPVPTKRVDRPTPLMDLWYKATYEPPLKTKPETDDTDTLNGLKPDFAELFTMESERLAEWLVFQFDDEELAEIFYSGGNTPEDLTRTEPFFSHLLTTSSAKAFARTLESQHLSIPTRHGPALQAFGGDKLRLVLAYAYHAFKKGFDYASRLEDQKVEYKPHWIRKRALMGRLAVVGDPEPPFALIDYASFFFRQADVSTIPRDLVVAGIQKLRSLSDSAPDPLEHSAKEVEQFIERALTESGLLAVPAVSGYANIHSMGRSLYRLWRSWPIAASIISWRMSRTQQHSTINRYRVVVA